MQIFISLEGVVLDVSQRYYAIYSDLLRQSGFQPFDAATYWSFKRLSIKEATIAERSSRPGFVEEYLLARTGLLEEPAYLMLDSLQQGVPKQLQYWSSHHDVILTSRLGNYQTLVAQLELLGLADTVADVLPCRTGLPGWEAARARLEGNLDSQKAALLVTDNEADLLAARALMIPSVAVTGGRRSRTLLQRTQPDYLTNSLEKIELVDRWESSASSGCRVSPH